ncbi:hypothetical protein L195_g045976 [Trifolium pratense]|uniref:Uncharacterized protein n=1 Tax=Trifolium pratense TaxID=57577 RepID=A0A2K3MGG9_TRIPR|nr:hypothetical protein L195_g045976 [Trifolium pratense]
MIGEEGTLHPRCGGSSGALGFGFHAVGKWESKSGVCRSLSLLSRHALTKTDNYRNSCEKGRETTVRFPSTAIGNELKSFDARTDIEIVIMFDSQT